MTRYIGPKCNRNPGDAQAELDRHVHNNYRLHHQKTRPEYATPFGQSLSDELQLEAALSLAGVQLDSVARQGQFSQYKMDVDHFKSQPMTQAQFQERYGRYMSTDSRGAAVYMPPPVGIDTFNIDVEINSLRSKIGSFELK